MALGAAKLRVVERCGRCVMTTLDPESGTRGAEPLRTLAGHRTGGGAIYFGVCLAPDNPGAVVGVGDLVSVLSSRGRATLVANCRQ